MTNVLDYRVTDKSLDILKHNIDTFVAQREINSVDCLYREDQFRDDVLVRSLIPSEIFSAVASFGADPRWSALRLRGLPLFGLTSAETPSSRPTGPTRWIQPAEIMHYFISSVLGTVFGWRAIQGGALVNDVMPIRKDAGQSISSNSVQFDLHTEDAISPKPPTFLSLLCIRNFEECATVLADLRNADFSVGEIGELISKPIPLTANKLNKTRIRVMRRPCLTRSADLGLTIQLNMNLLDWSTASDEELSLLTLLSKRLEQVSEKTVLNSGDLLIIDNRYVLHGRDAYKPYFDGNGRWLKRLYVSDAFHVYEPFLSSISPPIVDLDKMIELET